MLFIHYLYIISISFSPDVHSTFMGRRKAYVFACSNFVYLHFWSSRTNGISRISRGLSLVSTVLSLLPGNVSFLRFYFIVMEDLPLPPKKNVLLFFWTWPKFLTPQCLSFPIIKSASGPIASTPILKRLFFSSLWSI